MTIKIKVRKKVQSFEIKSKNISLQSKLNFLINAFFIVSMKIFFFLIRSTILKKIYHDIKRKY